MPGTYTRFDERDVGLTVIDHIVRTESAYLHSSYPYVSSSSPFKAIFKSVQHQREINDFYQKISTFPPVADKGVPRIFCARTEGEAQQYRARLPNLWETCRTTAYTLVDGFELYLCPKFVDIPADAQRPAPETCPTVEGNVFANNHFLLQLPYTRGNWITYATYRIYGRDLGIGDDWPPGHGPYIEQLNSGLKKAADTAYRLLFSYSLFTACKLHPRLILSISNHSNVVIVVYNECKAIPNTDKAPWPKHQGLASNGTANSTVAQTVSQVSAHSGTPIQGGAVVQRVPSGLVESS